MRKIIVGAQVSMDGVMQAPGGQARGLKISMSVTDSYQAFVVEQLSRVVPTVHAKRMFGGVGLYSADVFFALIADDVVYLKADHSTQAEFEALDLPPFRPFGERGTSMRYYQLPEEALENSDVLRTWAEKAIAVAKRAKLRAR